MEIWASDLGQCRYQPVLCLFPLLKNSVWPQEEGEGTKS